LCEYDLSTGLDPRISIAILAHRPRFDVQTAIFQPLPGARGSGSTTSKEQRGRVLRTMSSPRESGAGGRKRLFRIDEFGLGFGQGRGERRRDHSGAWVASISSTSKLTVPDFERFAFMPCPMASLACSGIKALSSLLARPWSRNAPRVLRKSSELGPGVGLTLIDDADRLDAWAAAARLGTRGDFA